MRRLASSIFLAAAAMAVGCAAHQADHRADHRAAHRAAQTPLGGVSPATWPADLGPRANIALEQIEPPARLASPAAPPREPPSMEALQAFAKAHLARLDGDHAAAIQLMEKAAALDPASFELHFTLGQLYQGEAVYDDRSIHELEAAAAIQPDDLELQTSLGRQYLAKNNAESALLHFRLAIQTHEYLAEDPRAAPADFFLANALARQGYDQAALAVYQRLAGRLRTPGVWMRMNAEASLLAGHLDALQIEIASLLQKLHRYEEAAAAFHHAAEKDPGNLDLRARECRCLMLAGRFDDAARVAMEGVVRSGASQASVDLLRDVYRSSGREADAADVLTKLHRHSRPD